MTAQLDRLVEAVCTTAAHVRGDVATVVRREVDRLAPLADAAERDELVARAVARLDGLDVLEAYLDDPTVDEVMVNRGREVWVDRRGTIERVADLPVGVIQAILERALATRGKRLDRTHPVVDTHLASGARLCAVVPPLAVDGTIVSIRRHRRRHLRLDQMASEPVAATLRELLTRHCNVVITGATSSGKTTLLAGLLATLPREERIVVVEDTTEIDVEQGHVVRLEARPSTADQAQAVPMVDLVRTALRLRPDRLIVGEFRGDEVVAMVQAMNTGHDGSWSTCHANSCLDALARVETLVMQAAPNWPLAAIRQQVSRSIDAVVHVRRFADGSRRVIDIAEVIESGASPAVRPLVVDGAVQAGITRGRR
jgi:pilus assembly protein CpaF